MEAIKTIFLQVAHNDRPVSDLIEVLTDKNGSREIEVDERNAYQAFCCAMLARQASNYMQKGQYIQEYNIFIQKSLMLNPELILGRLIRLMVEEQLQNVTFESHINEDKIFISENILLVNDEELVTLINKILAR